MRPSGPGDYTCKTALAIKVYFSVLKFDSQSTHLLRFPSLDLLSSTTTRKHLRGWALRTYTMRQRVLISWKIFSFKLKQVHHNFVHITYATKI
jgi:hypothetical protein